MREVQIEALAHLNVSSSRRIRLAPVRVKPNLEAEDLNKTKLILFFTRYIQGVFLHWASPKKLKYGKPRLGESTST